MGKRVGMEVSIAASEAVRLANTDVVAAYPITPQTHIVEHLSEFVNNGELDAEFVPVESEHSAMSVCLGSSAAGARTFTCTSSQGLILMSEIVYIASALRLPIVMVLANRSLSSPLSIWNDHTDVMAIRDCGWIQVFADNGQEVFDHVLWAYRVAEDRRVLHPVIVNIDGFILTHVIEPIELLDQETVDRFLPPYEPLHRLHPDKPVTMGCFAMPNLYTETKKAQDEALKATRPMILEGWKEFGDLTGRYYHPIEEYRTEDADLLIVTMGSLGETACVAADSMRAQGQSVGVLKIRLWRPFPFDLFRQAVRKASTLVVMDRATSYGGPGGPVSSELRAALYGTDHQPKIVNFIAGLAGRDVSPEDFGKMVDLTLSGKAKTGQEDYQIYGVRE
jgi:pyruvate ferredoxin oxidoreductase alpha subunit